jgi:hypothetical protein
MLQIEVDAATELPEITTGPAVPAWPLWVVLLAVVVAAVSPALRYFGD